MSLRAMHQAYARLYGVAEANVIVVDDTTISPDNAVVRTKLSPAAMAGH
eukprot:COSAG04_NODE_7097_length_1192_cov_1.285453_3_plen_49_part_00